jgi:hypothetical protein
MSKAQGKRPLERTREALKQGLGLYTAAERRPWLPGVSGFRWSLNLEGKVPSRLHTAVEGEGLCVKRGKILKGLGLKGSDLWLPLERTLARLE